jgi:hypothetical protein
MADRHWSAGRVPREHAPMPADDVIGTRTPVTRSRLVADVGRQRRFGDRSRRAGIL